jgi:hypothetical protein
VTIDWEAIDVQPNCTIRTDNEYTVSDAFQQAVQDEHFVLETTAPNTSHQNGMGERPHHTVKERIRCLLYTAAFGLEFWSDGLLHSVWLYNRTFHRALNMCPYEAYTKQTPTVDGLLTFGCRIVAKKSKKRSNATDPNAYDGIFLGYRATMDNIIYWDIHSQQKRTARHYKFDEVHYGTAPEKRNPAARHLIEVHTGTPHTERRTDVLLEPSTDVEQTTNPILDTNTQIIQDSPLPHTAPIPPILGANVHIIPDEPPTATVSRVTLPSPDELTQSLQLLDISLNITEPAITETVILSGTHPTLGLVTEDHPEYTDTVILKRMHPGTICHKTIPRWKSRLRGSIVRMIDEITVENSAQIPNIIRDKRTQGKSHVRIQFARPNFTALNGEGIPTLNFDQLNVIAHHLNAIDTGEDQWQDKSTWPPISDESIALAIYKGLAIPKLTRRKLEQSPAWDTFRSSEWIQLDKYHSQGMFGTPCAKPKDAIVLPWVWSYLYKVDPVTLKDVGKSRGTCNGGQKHGKIITLAETYAACVEQPAHRILWAVNTALNHIAIGIDVSNAYAEADGPDEKFYMVVDKQFHEWWTECLGNPPIPYGYVIPILKNLQGHPEGPRLWHKHIHSIMLDSLDFKACTHEHCLYYKRDEATNELILVLRQVDDFIISAKLKAAALAVKAKLQLHMTNPLHDLGIIKRFNGVDIPQTRHYVKVYAETYLTRVLQHHGWLDLPASNIPIPMRTETAFMAKLELSEGPTDEKAKTILETEMGFSYRQVIGEAIFAMTICRIDISPAIIKLSQYSENPAKCHYQALKNLWAFLAATKDEGLYYWRPEARPDLPDAPLPIPISREDKLYEYFPIYDPLKLKGTTDSTWGNDRKHRRSTGGVGFLLSGAAVYYRTRVQPTVAQSSTESELYTMVDGGKAALYIRSILEELGIEQLEPTEILCDNQGALKITNAQQPSRRTRHVEIKEFAVQHWVEDERVVYEDVITTHNPSDSLSKATGRIKFWEHFDVLMGRRLPQYASNALKSFRAGIETTIQFFSRFPKTPLTPLTNSTDA